MAHSLSCLGSAPRSAYCIPGCMSYEKLYFFTGNPVELTAAHDRPVSKYVLNIVRKCDDYVMKV